MAGLKVQSDSFWRVGLSFEDIEMNNVAKHPILGYFFKLFCPHMIAEIDMGTKKVIVNRKSLLKHLFTSQSSNIDIKDLKNALSSRRLNKLSSKSLTSLYKKNTLTPISSPTPDKAPPPTLVKLTPKINSPIHSSIAKTPKAISPELKLDPLTPEVMPVAKKTNLVIFSQEEFDSLTVKQLHELSSAQVVACFNLGLYQKRISTLMRQVAVAFHLSEDESNTIDEINEALNVQYGSKEEFLADISGLKKLPDNSLFLVFERGFYEAGRGVAATEKLERIKKLESTLNSEQKLQYEKSENFRLEVINKEFQSFYSKEEDFLREIIGQFWLSEKQIRQADFKTFELDQDEDENKVFFDAFFTCYKQLFIELLKNDSELFLKLAKHLPLDLISETFDESLDFKKAYSTKETLVYLVRSFCEFSPKQLLVLLNHGIFRSDLGDAKERYRITNFDDVMKLFELDSQADPAEKLDLEKVGNGLINIIASTDSSKFPKNEFMEKFSSYLPFLPNFANRLSKKDLKQIESLDFAVKYRSIAMDWLCCSGKSRHVVRIKKKIAQTLNEEQLLNFLNARRCAESENSINWVKYLPKELIAKVNFDPYARTCLTSEAENDPLIKALKKAAAERRI